MVETPPLAQSRKLIQLLTLPCSPTSVWMNRNLDVAVIQPLNADWTLGIRA
jgi:hypothetical protein